MARTRNRKAQAVRFFTNGKRADDAYGLSQHVDRVVRRTDVAVKKATVSTSRAATPIAKRAVLARFNIKQKELDGKISTRTTGDSIRLYAFQRRIPLHLFGGAWGGASSRGATAKIERGKSETFAQSFMLKSAVKRSGMTLRQAIRVRQRQGAKRAPRGPLQMLYGPSAYEMITGYRRDPETGSPQGSYGGDLARSIRDAIREIYVTELRRQYALEAGRG